MPSIRGYFLVEEIKMTTDMFNGAFAIQARISNLSGRVFIDKRETEL